MSTGKQAKSGLGLEAQIEAIRAFAKAEGYKVTGTFEEHESGKGADALDRRPQLAAAIKAAKKARLLRAGAGPVRGGAPPHGDEARRAQSAPTQLNAFRSLIKRGCVRTCHQGRQKGVPLYVAGSVPL